MARCEPSGCFRPDQRNRRVRPGAKDRPNSIFETTTPGPTTTTTTSTTPVPHPLQFLRIMSRFQTAVLSVPITTTQPPFYFDAYGGEKKVISKNLIVHEFSGSDTFSIFPYPTSETVSLLMLIYY